MATVHENLDNLLATFSIDHHRWLNTEEDKRSFAELRADFRDENKLKGYDR